MKPKALKQVMRATSKALLALVVLSLVQGCAHTDPQRKKDADIHYQLGVNAFHNQEPAKALRELFKALELNPEDPKIHNTIGLVYLGKEMYDKAEASFRKAIELKKDYSDAWNNLGAMYLALGRWDDAVEACQKAATDVLYPYPWLPYNNIGWAYFQKGDIDKALFHLKKAVELSPRFCRAWEHLGELYMSLNDLDKARSALQKAIDRCPGFAFPEAHFHLAVCLEKLGDTASSREELAKCAEQGGESELGERCRKMLGVPIGGAD